MQWDIEKFTVALLKGYELIKYVYTISTVAPAFYFKFTHVKTFHFQHNFSLSIFHMKQVAGESWSFEHQSLGINY